MRRPLAEGEAELDPLLAAISLRRPVALFAAPEAATFSAILRPSERLRSAQLLDHLRLPRLRWQGAHDDRFIASGVSEPVAFRPRILAVINAKPGSTPTRDQAVPADA